MKIQNQLTDKSVLEEVGRRLAKYRLDLSLTQGEVATQAGLGKRTVERIESGEPTQMDTLIRILRTLNLLDRLDTLIPEESTPRPMELLKSKGKRRQRASSPRGLEKTVKIPAQNWSWGDDK